MAPRRLEGACRDSTWSSKRAPRPMMRPKIAAHAKTPVPTLTANSVSSTKTGKQTGSKCGT
jgi:hypothetical protein